MIAIGVLARRRWGLLLALCFMVQVVMSNLAFVIAYLPIRSEWMSVRLAASEGPMMVMITLYLWIRATDLIFDAPASPVRVRHAPVPQRQQVVTTNSSAGDVAAIAD